MKTEIIKITPTIAKKYLQTNTENNRRLKDEHVNMLAEQMLNNAWRQHTGESIKFDKTGKLIDGQHRLHALVKSNLSLSFMVVTNLDKDTFQVIDTGVARSSSDVFYISQIKNATALAKGLKQFSLLKEGMASNQISSTRLKLSNQKLINLYNENPELWQEWCRKCNRWYNGFSHVLSHSIIFGLATYFSEKSKKGNGKIENFFDELCLDNTTNLSIKLLRKRLIDDRLKKNEKMKSEYKVVYIIKTWNAYISGNDIRALSFAPDKEDIPVPL